MTRTLKKTYVYGLICDNGTLYIGWTDDLDTRINKHFDQAPTAAEYTKAHKPVKVLFRAEVPNKVYENEITKMAMSVLGRDSVRGGFYTRDVVGAHDGAQISYKIDYVRYPHLVRVRNAIYRYKTRVTKNKV